MGDGEWASEDQGKGSKELKRQCRAGEWWRQRWAVGQGKTLVDIQGAIPGFRLAGRYL